MARPGTTVRTAPTEPGANPESLLSERDQARALVPVLRALADETRLTLLFLLAERPRTVKELQEATGLSQALVSHHLSPLREKGLVTVAPVGRSNRYALCCSALVEPMRMFAGLAAIAPDMIEALLPLPADRVDGLGE